MYDNRIWCKTEGFSKIAHVMGQCPCLNQLSLILIHLFLFCPQGQSQGSPNLPIVCPSKSVWPKQRRLPRTDLHPTGDDLLVWTGKTKDHSLICLKSKVVIVYLAFTTSDMSPVYMAFRFLDCEDYEISLHKLVSEKGFWAELFTYHNWNPKSNT